MIITRTPYRMSFLGGGTDLPEFYERDEGMVLSTTIDRYTHIALCRGFEPHFRLCYSRTEIVDDVDHIQHPLIREAIRLTDLTHEPLHLWSMGDIPAGSGLGSSGAFLVGLLKALWTYAGRHVTPEELAEQACRIEIGILREPVGRQDQYAAALGGLRWYRFRSDGTVDSEPVAVTAAALAALEEHILAFHLGSSRLARSVLNEQRDRVPEALPLLRQMRDLVPDGVRALEGAADLSAFGELLHLSWELKKQLASGISSTRVDEYYERAREAGALGGKILGAGGTGFLLIFCAPRLHDAVRAALADLPLYRFGLSREGSRLIFYDRPTQYGGTRVT